MCRECTGVHALCYLIAEAYASILSFQNFSEGTRGRLQIIYSGAYNFPPCYVKAKPGQVKLQWKVKNIYIHT